MSEELFSIKGYEGRYATTESGRVWSYYRGGKWLYPYVSGTGYYYVDLKKDKLRKQHAVHRLIITTLLPNPNNFPCVNHKDGNKLNNHISNLEWCTYSQNNKHAVLLGKMHNSSGKLIGMPRKIDRAQVRYIRYKAAQGYSTIYLAELFNLTQRSIYALIIGATWKSVE